MSYMRDASGRRLDSFEVAEGSPLQVASRSILSRLNPVPVSPVSPIASEVPTVTIGTVATLTGRIAGVATGELTEVSSRGTWSTGGPRLVVNSVSGIDTFLTDSAFEIDFLGSSFGTHFAIFVDGRPISTTLTDVGALTTGTRYYLKIAFGSIARRRVEVYGEYVGGWYGIRGNATAAFEPAPRRPVAAWIGDSFYAGSALASPLRCAGFLAARMLGIEPYLSSPLSAGSTGYIAAGSQGVFGATARLDLVEKGKAELIVVQGSLNDDASAASVQAAATQFYANLATRRPLAPVIVLGPQPSSGSTTSTARQANNAAVRAAAMAAPNVIAFFDQIGNSAGQPPGYVGSTVYATGDRVLYNTSVWQFRNDGLTPSTAGAPGADSRWGLATWGYYGTGRLGAPTGDGSRDVLCANDGTHPTDAGALVLAGRTDDAIRRALANFVATGQRLVA